MQGGIVKLRNGMVGEIISVTKLGWRDRFEVLIDGTRCYVDPDDVRVASVLDRIVDALDKSDKEDHAQT